MSHWGPNCNNCIYKDDNCHACTYMPIDVLKDEENDNLKMNEESKVVYEFLNSCLNDMKYVNANKSVKYYERTIAYIKKLEDLVKKED